MGYSNPVWETPPNLGTFLQDYSFDLNPLRILYGASGSTTVTLINGLLPIGLNYLAATNYITIYGAATESTTVIFGQFTFRLMQSNGAIADRTYYLTLTPILIAPSWANQTPLLGYQANNVTGTYLVTATTTTGDHIFYDLPTSPSGATIDTYTGLLTYTPVGITVDATFSTVVRATDSINATNSNIVVIVNVVAASSPPYWITSPGSIGNYYGTTFVEYQLQATDPFFPDITYSFILTDPNFPLSIANTGVIYGTLPNVLSTTIWNFVARATSNNGITDNYLSILVLPAIVNAGFSWTTPSNLGSIDEGQYVTVAIQSTSNRNTTIVYNVTGGLLPPHLILGTTSGLIVGFCEYTAIGKSYYFDITAYDGYQYITQQFSLVVNKIYNNQYFSAYIPVTGNLRNVWNSDSSNIRIREPGTVVFDTMSNTPDTPMLNIINGLVTGYATSDQILNVMAPWWHELNLQIGSATNTIVLSDGFSTVYRNIIDSQSTSNIIIADSHVLSGNVYPISINNIRNSLISTYPYVSSGSGTGFAMLPNLNYSNGSVSSVTVLDSGYNYLSPPSIIITGSGSGANLKAVLGLVGVTVLSSNGWQVGDIIQILSDNAPTIAKLIVTETNSLHSIITLDIVEAGNYLQVGSSTTTYIINGSSTCSLNLIWGIVSVTVVDGGVNYQCGITVSLAGGEILPEWQTAYIPAIKAGELPIATANTAAYILNYETATLWGTPWQPTIMVMQWQGVSWLGAAMFDGTVTTWDGDTTRFQDTLSPFETIFDKNQEIFDNGLTIFDYQDPLSYDLFQVWGSTLIDAGTTVVDLYSTIFDALGPRTYSNTMLRKWITTSNKIYSGNNAVY